YSVRSLTLALRLFSSFWGWRRACTHSALLRGLGGGSVVAQNLLARFVGWHRSSFCFRLGHWCSRFEVWEHGSFRRTTACTGLLDDAQVTFRSPFSRSQ